MQSTISQIMSLPAPSYVTITSPRDPNNSNTRYQEQKMISLAGSLRSISRFSLDATNVLHLAFNISLIIGENNPYSTSNQAYKQLSAFITSSLATSGTFTTVMRKNAATITSTGGNNGNSAINDFKNATAPNSCTIGPYSEYYIQTISPTPAPTSGDSSSSSSVSPNVLSGGAIAGIVIGSVLLIVIVCYMGRVNHASDDNSNYSQVNCSEHSKLYFEHKQLTMLLQGDDR